MKGETRGFGSVKKAQNEQCRYTEQAEAPVFNILENGLGLGAIDRTGAVYTWG